MAPFGPVLDIVAKLNSTKSFCWLKEKIVISTAQARRAHQVHGVPHPQFHFILAFPLALKATWARNTWIEELYRSKSCWANRVKACFPPPPFSYEKVHHPDHPKKRCPELFVTYWLIDISGGPVTYRLDYLPIQTVLILHQKRKFNSSMNSSVVRKQPPHI